MSVSKTLLNIRKVLEEDLWLFAKAINPLYQYAEIHERLLRWLQEDDEDVRRKLSLLPRGHLKSHCVAVWTTWEITRHPWTSIVYLSAGEDLAKAQIFAIKGMMTSKWYTKFWPEMLNKEEGRRELWNAFGFNVDHDLRKEYSTRDQTLLVRTVKSNAIGLHCDHVVFDDVVVPSFAYSETGRKELQRSISQYSSILNPGGTIKAVGTRYHPKDAYASWIEAEERIWCPDKKDFIGERKVWDVMEEKVEDAGDGTGTFLWPRTISPSNGQAYGFDVQELERIKAGYRSNNETSQFWAQYYNEPNSAADMRVDPNCFQYYNRKHITVSGGYVKYKGANLNVFAAMDVAWSDGRTSDSTAIAVIGLDSEGFVYILDLDEFKTSIFSEYYDRIQTLQDQWGFRKIRIETNAGGKFVAQEVERMIRQNGGNLVVEGRATTKHDGKKQERHAAIAEARYHNKTIWHYKGGYTSVLEEQVIQERPPHDDILDALCAAIEISKPPAKRRETVTNETKIIYNTKFGGRRGR